MKLMDNVAFSFCHLYPMYGFLLFCHNKRSSYDLDFTIEEPLQLHIYRKSFTLPPEFSISFYCRKQDIISIVRSKQYSFA